MTTSRLLRWTLLALLAVATLLVTVCPSGGVNWDIRPEPLLLSARPRVDTIHKDLGIVCDFGNPYRRPDSLSEADCHAD